MPDKKKSQLSEARLRANKKYNDKFIGLKVRVTPEFHTEIQEHAAAMHESITAFITRAIRQAMTSDAISLSDSEDNSQSPA